VLFLHDTPPLQRTQTACQVGARPGEKRRGGGGGRRGGMESANRRPSHDRLAREAGRNRPPSPKLRERGLGGAENAGASDKPKTARGGCDAPP
jgi:hypothetical protein